jgi:hypothetical protein
MTVTREELRQLVDELPDDKVAQVAEYARAVGARGSDDDSAHRDAWMAAGRATNGRTDNATRVDELLAQGFGRSRRNVA